jgi:hypothetical protein
VWIGQTLRVRLQVSDLDIAPPPGGETTRFQLYGAAPPDAAVGILSAEGVLSQGAVLLDFVNRTASAELVLRGSRKLSGSRYKVCARGIEASNLTTDVC